MRDVRIVFPFISRRNRDGVLKVLHSTGGSSYKLALALMYLWSFLYALDAYVYIEGLDEVFSMSFMYVLLLSGVAMLVSICITGYLSFITMVVMARSKSLDIDTRWEDSGSRFLIENAVWMSVGFSCVWGSLYLYITSILLIFDEHVGGLLLNLASPLMLVIVTLTIKRMYGFPARARHVLFIILPILTILAFASYVTAYSI